MSTSVTCCSLASFPNLSLEFIISLDDLIASNQLSLTLSHLSFLVLGVHNFGHTKKMAKYIQTSIVTRFFRRKVSLTRTCLLLFGKPMKYIQSASPFSFQFYIQLVYKATASFTIRIQILSSSTGSLLRILFQFLSFTFTLGQRDRIVCFLFALG